MSAGYRCHVPDEWRETQRREHEATLKAEAERQSAKQSRAASRARTLHAAWRIVRMAALIIGVVVLAAGVILAAVGSTRRR
jgi:F0F1-type ATP synthase assembly protein I